MKRSITYIAVAIWLAFAASISAQSPMAVNYQGVAIGSDGIAITDTDVNLRISINENGSDGQIVYQESHVTVTNGIGHYMIEIGRGNLLQGAFSNIIWGENGYWTHIEIDLNNSGTYESLARVEFLSVPYANYALTAETGISGPRGAQGPDGATGPIGQASPIGPSCPGGQAGETGDTGPAGRQGLQGPKGPDGYPILVARSDVPTNIAEGRFYMDDGTNRSDGTIGMRFYNGSAWIDL